MVKAQSHAIIRMIYLLLLHIEYIVFQRIYHYHLLHFHLSLALDRLLTLGRWQFIFEIFFPNTMHAKYFLFCVHLLCTKCQKWICKRILYYQNFRGNFFIIYLNKVNNITKYFIWGLVIRRGHLAVDFYRRAVVVISVL